MAEGGKIIHVYNNYYLDRGTIVYGDNVRSKTDVEAGHIGRVEVAVPGGLSQSHETEKVVQALKELKLAETECDDTQPRREITKPARIREENVQARPIPKPRTKLKDPTSPETQPRREMTKHITFTEEDVQTRPIPIFRTKSENKSLRIKAEMISDKAKLLIAKSDYEGAVSLLEQPCVLESDYFLPKLMLAETYLQLGKEHRAVKMIGDVEKTIMTSSDLTPDDVKEYANGFIESSFYVRAMVLLRIASVMYETSANSPDDVMSGIFSCMLQTRDATESLKVLLESGGRKRKIGVEYGIEYMIEIYEKLRAVENANPANKAWNEAWSCCYIGGNLTLAGEKKESIKIRQTGVEVFLRQFGPDAVKYKIYAELLHGLGVNHLTLYDFSQAAAYFEKAIRAKETATDYEQESGRQKAINDSKYALKIARAKLGNKRITAFSI